MTDTIRQWAVALLGVCWCVMYTRATHRQCWCNHHSVTGHWRCWHTVCTSRVITLASGPHLVPNTGAMSRISAGSRAAIRLNTITHSATQWAGGGCVCVCVCVCNAATLCVANIYCNTTLSNFNHNIEYWQPGAGAGAVFLVRCMLIAVLICWVPVDTRPGWCWYNQHRFIGRQSSSLLWPASAFNSSLCSSWPGAWWSLHQHHWLLSSANIFDLSEDRL